MTREELISYFDGKDNDTIAIAIMYAEHYLKDGINITEKLDTAAKQAYMMQRAENRGYAAALEDMREHNVVRWIPISDKKPRSNGVYIVARWFSDGVEKKILTDACYFDGTYEWHDDTRINHGRVYVTDKIVAWMPLPEPPREVNGNVGTD